MQNSFYSHCSSRCLDSSFENTLYTPPKIGINTLELLPYRPIARLPAASLVKTPVAVKRTPDAEAQSTNSITPNRAVSGFKDARAPKANDPDHFDAVLSDEDEGRISKVRDFDPRALSYKTMEDALHASEGSTSST